MNDNFRMKFWDFPDSLVGARVPEAPRVAKKWGVYSRGIMIFEHHAFRLEHVMRLRFPPPPIDGLSTQVFPKPRSSPTWTSSQFTLGLKNPWFLQSRPHQFSSTGNRCCWYPPRGHNISSRNDTFRFRGKFQTQLQ